MAYGEEILIERFAKLVAMDRRNTAEMLRCFDEIDQRQLWASEGYSSMFAWCTGRFHMSQSKAGKCIHATRIARRFPIVLEMIEAGALHLSGLCKLGAHLTDENHREVLARATHKSEREIEELIVELAPKPDAPTRITRVAVPMPTPSSLFSERTIVSAPSQAKAPSKVEPLSPGRYKVQVTVGRDTYDKLQRLQNLLSHATTDPAEILDRALDALLEETLKKRAAEAKAPRQPKPRAESTRVVPAAVKREVWKRDAASCAFVSTTGHRCSETRLLQLHHVRPFARGGEATTNNLELRCAAHNQFQANQDFGALFMHAKRREHAAPHAQTSHAR